MVTFALIRAPCYIDCGGYPHLDLYGLYRIDEVESVMAVGDHVLLEPQTLNQVIGIKAYMGKVKATGQTALIVLALYRRESAPSAPGVLARCIPKASVTTSIL